MIWVAVAGIVLDSVPSDKRVASFVVDYRIVIAQQLGYFFQESTRMQGYQEQNYRHRSGHSDPMRFELNKRNWKTSGS